VIESVRHRRETDFDIAQALAVRELREDEHQKLIPVAEGASPLGTFVPVDAPLKRRMGSVGNELREYRRTLIHWCAPGKRSQEPRSVHDRAQVVLWTIAPQIVAPLSFTGLAQILNRADVVGDVGM
jgi:hypothetical protein